MNAIKTNRVILVVSDAPPTRSYLREVLAPGYVIEEAPDGAEGFQQAKALIPDLAVIDIDLPTIDGTQLCKALKKDNETWLIPVIMLSYESLEDCIIKGFESGADDCIAWPFNTKILKARIKNLVDSRKQMLDRIRAWVLLQPDEPGTPSENSRFVRQLHGIIEEHLSDPLFTVEELCDRLCMSRASMYRKIHSLTGESPQLFIRSYRLKRAAQLLENDGGNVTEVCFNVGFTSTAYFAKCFKEKFHLPPRAYAYNSSNGNHNGSL